MEEDFLPGLLSADEFCKPAGALVSEGCALVPQTGEEAESSFLGTDLHRTDFRPPVITEAVKWLIHHINPEALEEMVHRNPVCIIKNEKYSKERIAWKMKKT